MKTLAKTVFAIALTAVVFTSSAMAATVTTPETTVSAANTLPAFNRIWVSGNVKLVLTQGSTNTVAGDEHFDPAITYLKSDGKTLFINSTASNQVTLKISMKDLERIEAYGQSVVVTSSNFDVKNLQLFLNQSATAKINTTAKSLYTVVQEDAVLKLNGSAQHSTLVAANMKNVKMNDFASQRSASYTSEEIMKAEETAMVLAK
ncbi:GIN domain-containing protein [Pedobacter aquatilis]|uniref:GIN domain-containing protein n=1 Tax=Pedobacter aquatilis TaxID=351343 RepID=UPI00292D6E50|nr:DUF2807 domain-containing protein [Pedobacter aquatilis]